MNKRRNLRVFVKADSNGEMVPSVLIYRKQKPKEGNWIELNASLCCTSTTTTTTSSTTTTTTTEA